MFAATGVIASHGCRLGITAALIQLSPIEMNILLLNQAFYPDIVSTAQHAGDLARGLTQAGHEVTVICNSRGYDDPKLRFSPQETWNGIKIIRVRSTAFGKSFQMAPRLRFRNIHGILCLSSVVIA